MSCSVLTALYALINQWLASAGASLLSLASTLRHIPHTAAAAARLLLSFESLVLVYLLSFAFLGGALTLLLFSDFWDKLDDRDEYDDCENGVYYDYAERDGRWMGVAVPVILVDGGVLINGARRSNSASRGRKHDYEPNGQMRH